MNKNGDSSADVVLGGDDKRLEAVGAPKILVDGVLEHRQATKNNKREPIELASDHRAAVAHYKSNRRRENPKKTTTRKVTTTASEETKGVSSPVSSRPRQTNTKKSSSSDRESRGAGRSSPRSPRSQQAKEDKNAWTEIHSSGNDEPREAPPVYYYPGEEADDAAAENEEQSNSSRRSVSAHDSYLDAFGPAAAALKSPEGLGTGGVDKNENLGNDSTASHHQKWPDRKQPPNAGQPPAAHSGGSAVGSHTTRMDRGMTQPGAVPMHGINHRNSDSSSDDGNGATHPEDTQNNNDDEGGDGSLYLAVAHLVNEDSDDQEDDEEKPVVMASPVPRFEWNRKTFALLIAAMLVVGGVVAVAVVTGVAADVVDSTDPTKPEDFGTASPLTYLERSLPNYTLRAIESEGLLFDSRNNSDSNATTNWTASVAAADPLLPQGKAWKWMALDPNLGTYSQESAMIRFAVATLYYATDGPGSWAVNGNNNDTASYWMTYEMPVCSWSHGKAILYRCVDVQGVNGDRSSTQRMNQISLDNMGLNGTLPLEIGLLSTLTELTLINNPGLAGTIPTTIAQMSALNKLNLRGNGIQGYLPDELFQLQGIHRIDLRWNKMTGTIPAAVSNLASIKFLYLSANNFRSNLPTEIASLSTLTEFRVAENKLLSGTIGDDLWMSWKENLSILHLHDCSFWGTLPTNIGLLSELIDLRIYNNRFSGTIPSQIGQLSNMYQLIADSNSFMGQLPTEIALLGRIGGSAGPLDLIDLSYNKLSGTLPVEIGDMPSLRLLYLENNTFTGTLPEIITNLKQLQDLDLSFNKELRGTIPTGIGTMNILRRLDLQMTKLSGTIPSEIGQLSELLEVVLSHTLLTGTVPSEVCSLIRGGMMTLFEIQCSQIQCTCGCDCAKLQQE